MVVMVAQRFFAKVSIEGECWIWGGYRDADGYGQFWDGERMVLAHRWSLEHYSGAQLGELQACHSCDVPACVNPAHLFAGSALDNVRDCQAKGRRRSYEISLTRAQVAEIRARIRGVYGEQTLIAREYGIHRSTVSRIAAGRRRATV